MREEFEAELRVALARGLLSSDEVDSLREEALRMDRSPLELLHERDLLSGETLTSMRREAQGATDPSADQTLTRGPPPVRPPESPAFPVSGWDRYQYVRFLGQGGMGRVFLAYEPRLRRNVALKFVRDDDPALAQRFLSEARAQARVNHERVCKVYEVGEVQGRIYIAMQYIEGRPLSALAGELSVEQLALVLRDAALGVHEAHRVGLIHRDLKPSNIMVERTADGELKPYVMDFGLARDWKEETTATGTVLGTPHYMAPEQARGEVATLDRRADVYSLGATLYAVLTGQPPIPGSNGLEVLSNIAALEPRPPRALNPNVPADLEAIALKSLEKDRSARYDSARALADELERFLSGEPVLARSAGVGYRLRKRLRKHRALASVTAAALLVVMVALGWAGLQRREVLLRERLARRFTELVERIEAGARYSDLSRLHDTREDRKALRARMAELEEEIRGAGERAVGPGHYALGRGHLALGDEAKAREYLESAWRHDFREPRVAYALSLVLSHFYQRQLLEAERLRSAEAREARKREIQEQYRAPLLAYLKQSEGPDVPSTEYVSALIAFHEDRFEEALVRLDTLGVRQPWFYEAPKLRGDILLARATARWNAGDSKGALEDFDAGRVTYARAAAIAESVASVHAAMGELEYAGLLMELYGQGDVKPYFDRGLQAVSRALAAAPDDYASRVLEARFHRRFAEDRFNHGTQVEDVLQKSIASGLAARELMPTRPEARMELGRAWWQWARTRQGSGQDPREQLGKAIESLESIAPEARDYDFHNHRGLVFKTWADFEDQSGADSLAHRARAIDSYREAIRLNERLTDAWINLGVAYFTRASNPSAREPDADLQQAMEALERARGLNPKHLVPYFYGGQVHALAAQRRREQGGDPQPDIRAAEEQFQKGLEINAGMPQLHNALGSLWLEEATDAWERGANPDAFLTRARERFEQAMRVAPNQGFAYNNLGELLSRRASFDRALGRNPSATVEEAAKLFQTALEKMPGEPMPWANLGGLYVTLATFELSRGRTPEAALDKALAALDKALALNPDLGQARQQRSEALALAARWRARRGVARAEDFERAKQSYEEALKREPGRLELLLSFGHFCRHHGAWLEEAGQEPGPMLRRGRELAEKVLHARPHWPDAQVLHASVLLALANATDHTGERRDLEAQAAAELEQALAANPHLEHEGRPLMPTRVATGPSP